MKQRLPLLWLIASACWSETQPTFPEDVEVLFHVRPVYETECGQLEFFVADVAVGTDHVIATTMKWGPPMNCDGGGGNIETYDVPVFRIPIGGGPPVEDMAGKISGGLAVDVGAYGQRSIWVVADNTNAQALHVGGDDGVAPLLSYSGGGFQIPAGIVLDDTDAYVVTTSNAPEANVDLNNPQYPCCPFGTPSGGETTSMGWKLGFDGSTNPLTLPSGMYVLGAGGSVKTGMVGNTTDLFFLLRDSARTSEDVELRRISKTNPADMPIISQIPRAGGIPVGFAANDSVVVWTRSQEYDRYPLPDPLCVVLTRDAHATTSEKGTNIFGSTTFSCQDAAVDNTHVYFAIIQIDDNSDNDGQSGPYGMRGIGLGRVSLDGAHTFESVRLGIEGQYSGPRRVYVTEDRLYLVDPFTVVSVPKTALADKHDFSD